MIYCIGESLYDIVFRDGKPEWARPGGGMLNCAVTLGKAGAEVCLMTELGNDTVGKMILHYLEESGVGTGFMHITSANTALALAFLDEDNNADYQFYIGHREEAPAFTVPDFSKGDVLVFGSLYSVNRRNRNNIVKLALAAHNGGAIVLYDPNFRKAHLSKLPEVLPFIRENILLSDIVRGSDEDFEMITSSTDARTVKVYGVSEVLQENAQFDKRGESLQELNESSWNLIKQSGGKTLIITRNAMGADLFLSDKPIHFPAPPVKVTNTIGAGDAFNAGIAYQLHKNDFPQTEAEWGRIIHSGLEFAEKHLKN